MPTRRVKADGRIWKVCPKCGIDKPHDDEAYSRSGKNKDGSTRYYTRCKDCANKDAKQIRKEMSETARERKKRKMRARQRAWIKLGQRYPKELQELYAEEMVREYLENGPIP